jgi:hypothetical protein
VEPRIPGSFAPPPKRRKRMPGGQPWPKDKNGRDWPRDRWGRPMRPLWDYPPGVRAPGESVAPGEPGSVTTDDAIDAYLRAEARFADPAAQDRAPHDGTRLFTAPAAWPELARTEIVVAPSRAGGRGGNRAPLSVAPADRGSLPGIEKRRYAPGENSNAGSGAPV